MRPHERRLAGIARQLHGHRSGACKPGVAVRRTAAAEEEEELRAIPWAEIMTHNSADSAWVVIRDRVYDVTEFIQVRDLQPAASTGLRSGRSAI